MQLADLPEYALPCLAVAGREMPCEINRSAPLHWKWSAPLCTKDKVVTLCLHGRTFQGVEWRR